MNKLHEILTNLYGKDNVEPIIHALGNVIKNYRQPVSETPPLTEKEIALICYGDSFQSPDRSHLQTLYYFLNRHLRETISIVHLLPFFPYSSDDGFSVIDYKLTNPDLGDWFDIDNLGDSYGLIIDAVVNHISSKSDWFQEYLKGNPKYKDFFIEVDPNTDLSSVIRARAHPLLTTFNRDSKDVHLWTTFSADQIDLNYQNPDVLIKMLDVLLFYASKSARIIRLDAIGHAWKKIGTSCLNLPGAHRLVQLFREVMNMVFPNVQLLTETNVPHKKNIQYFGDGTNEAQLVYQFALPGLVIHSFLNGNCIKLTEWAKTLTLDSATCTYFNLLASHDGIGIRPLLEILNDSEISNLTQTALNRGGFISYKKSGNTRQDPYELNITLYDILADPGQSEEVNIRKFITAHAILLAMQGIPAIYYHSLFASSGDYDGIKKNGQDRSINRKKLNIDEIERELSSPLHRASKTLSEIKRLAGIRKLHPAFNPYSPQKIYSLSDNLFIIERIARYDNERLLAIHNLSNDRVTFTIPNDIIINFTDSAQDLITGRNLKLQTPIFIPPYGFTWLKIV